VKKQPIFSRKVIIFAFFCLSSVAEANLQRLLATFRNLGWFIVVVENVTSFEPSRSTQDFADIWISRRNQDFDLGAYRVGIQWLRQECGYEWDSLERVVFANSSVFYTPTFVRNVVPVIEGMNRSGGLTRSLQYVSHFQTFFFWLVKDDLQRRSVYWALTNKFRINSKQNLIYREVGISCSIAGVNGKIYGLFPDGFNEFSGKRREENVLCIEEVHSKSSYDIRECFKNRNPSHHYVHLLSERSFPLKFDLWRVLDEPSILKLLISQEVVPDEATSVLNLFQRKSWHR
jgi:hypothetical protein